MKSLSKSRVAEQKSVLDAVTMIWKEHPELRFGQLIQSISIFALGDIFYTEDKEWPELIAQWVRWKSEQ